MYEIRDGEPGDDNNGPKRHVLALGRLSVFYIYILTNIYTDIY
jgi:hypothetical protein